MKINRGLTAIKRNRLSAPIKWALDRGQIRSQVYDWGCGRGDDVELLRNEELRGLKVIGYDPVHFPKNAPETVDFSRIKTIICNYVLNVIENKRERTMLLKKIAGKINDDTSVILSVRKDTTINREAKKGNYIAYRDGFVTSRNTFQKGFNMDEIESLCERYFDISVDAGLSDGIVLVLRKKDEFSL